MSSDVYTSIEAIYSSSKDKVDFFRERMASVFFYRRQGSDGWTWVFDPHRTPR
jgi:hypothetical protein